MLSSPILQSISTLVIEGMGNHSANRCVDSIPLFDGSSTFGLDVGHCGYYGTRIGQASLQLNVTETILAFVVKLGKVVVVYCP